MIPKKSKLARIRAFSSMKEIRSVQGVLPALPNFKCPITVRAATRREIADIPGDRYVVMEIVPAASQHRISPGRENPEEKLLYLIALQKEINKGMNSIRFDIRDLMLGGGGGGDNEPPRNIFNPPIKENLMSNCIVGVMYDFFQDEDTCTICNRKYNRMEFCVLMHIYFKYIGILKNSSRLPFSIFLQEKVFAGKSQFGERTYNTYASKDIFQTFRNELKELKVDFTKHPKLPPDPTESILKPAFQEIGWAFQHSDYFSELRVLKSNLQTFNI